MPLAPTITFPVLSPTENVHYYMAVYLEAISEAISTAKPFLKENAQGEGDKNDKAFTGETGKDAHTLATPATTSVQTVPTVEDDVFT